MFENGGTPILEEYLKFFSIGGDGIRLCEETLGPDYYYDADYPFYDYYDYTDWANWCWEYDISTDTWSRTNVRTVFNG